jgi:hypothetical protein
MLISISGGQRLVLDAQHSQHGRRVWHSRACVVVRPDVAMTQCLVCLFRIDDMTQGDLWQQLGGTPE